MAHKLVVFLHLLGFCAYLGAAFAQQRLMSRSRAGTLTAAVRDEYERLAAAIVTKIELPALFAQAATGIAFIALSPSWLTQGWLHAKLACVVVLLGLSHAEMFNARNVVKARSARGEAADDEVARRKSRHSALGLVGTFAVLILVGLVAYGTG